MFAVGFEPPTAFISLFAIYICVGKNRGNRKNGPACPVEFERAAAMDPKAAVEILPVVIDRYFDCWSALQELSEAANAKNFKEGSTSLK